MAAVTRLGLYGGPRGLYGDFSGKAAAAVQMSGSTGFAWTPSGDLDVELTLAGSTTWDTAPTGDLSVTATLVGGTGFSWSPTGNLGTDAIGNTRKRIKDHTGLVRFETIGERNLDDLGEF